MNSTQGVLEACYNLFMEMGAAYEKQHDWINTNPQVSPFAKEQMTGYANADPGAVYVALFSISVNDYIKRPGMIEDLLHRPKLFKPLTASDVLKYAVMDTAAFAQMLYDICTEHGSMLTNADDEKRGFKAPIMLDRCLYAAYVYVQVDEYLERKNATFLPVPLPNAIRSMPLINISNPVQDDLTKEWTVKAGKVSYKLTRPTVSTPALQFLDYIAYECRRTGKASFEMDIRDYAAFKKRSTAKSALQRLQEEVYAQMQEVANIEFKVLEVVDGKEKEIGQIKIGGGTIIAPTRGKMRINLNQDLVSYLYILAPTDYPAQLFTVDPRTSTYYFGRYIAANWRMNEGKPGREKKILMRTLVAQSPNLPTYDAVMKGNRDLTGRIVKKTFNDLDALDALYYDFYTADGKHIEDTEALDYNTFINGYIIAEYFDIQQHPERVQAKLDRQKKITAAKEKAQAKAAAKKAAAGNA